MPGIVESETATVQPPATGGAPAGRPSPAVQMVWRDMAGHVIEHAAPVRVEEGCSHVAVPNHAPGLPLCARQPIAVPMSFGPILYALAGGILILGGALTFYERGPGRLIKPRPRRRGAARRARRWRRRSGIAIVVVGCCCLLRAFG